jgi:hypothetical protein
MPITLPITLDTLTAALTGSTVQGQVSATDLYNALEMELERLSGMYV